jgi:hypothetical protein
MMSLNERAQPGEPIIVRGSGATQRMKLTGAAIRFRAA